MVALSKFFGGTPNARFFVRNERSSFVVFCASKTICVADTEDDAFLIADCLEFAARMINQCQVAARRND